MDSLTLFVQWAHRDSTVARSAFFLFVYVCSVRPYLAGQGGVCFSVLDCDYAVSCTRILFEGRHEMDTESGIWLLRDWTLSERAYQN